MTLKNTSMFDSECYIAYVNLDHRKDRLDHITKELQRVGLWADKMRGRLPNEFDLSDPKYKKMISRTPGALGCMICQIEIMKTAHEKGKHAFVLEDDVSFCQDFFQRMDLVMDFLSVHEWDVFWLGGTYHIKPEWHVKGHYQMPECDCDLDRDFEPTDDSRIVRTYGCWSTYAYIVNNKSLEKVIDMLEDHLPKSVGIDTSFIYLQPKLHTYAFVPGMVKQIDNMSDIGRGVTKFSGFAALGPHWYADKM